MTQNIRVGLVGYGMAGRVFHAPYIRSTTSLQIITISTSRKEEVNLLDPTILVVSSPQEIFQNPNVDLVVIASPSNTHASLTAEALRAGKHVVVDKPFALTLQEAQDLVTLSKVMNKQLFVFHNRRWDSDFLTIKQALEEEIIGEVKQFESHIDRFRPIIQNRWREDGSEGSGVWFDLGPHLVDQALILFGRPQAIYADITVLREGGKSPDYAHVILYYPHRRVILQASMNAPGGKAGGLPRFAVYGTKGSLVKQGVDPQEAQSIAGRKPGDMDWGVDRDPLRIFDGIGGGVESTRSASVGCQQKFYEIVGEVLLAEKSGASVDVTGPISHDEMLLVQEVIEAGLVSAKEQKVVQFNIN